MTKGFDTGMTVDDLLRIESKLDLILDALGLTDNRRLAPCEIKAAAKEIVRQYMKKRGGNEKP